MSAYTQLTANTARLFTPVYASNLHFSTTSTLLDLQFFSPGSKCPSPTVRALALFWIGLIFYAVMVLRIMAIFCFSSLLHFLDWSEHLHCHGIVLTCASHRFYTFPSRNHGVSHHSIDFLIWMYRTYFSPSWYHGKAFACHAHLHFSIWMCRTHFLPACFLHDVFPMALDCLWEFTSIPPLFLGRKPAELWMVDIKHIFLASIRAIQFDHSSLLSSSTSMLYTSSSAQWKVSAGAVQKVS